MKAGTLAGRVAVEAINSGDCSKKALLRYEIEWRKTLGDRLKKERQLIDLMLSFNNPGEIYNSYVLRELLKRQNYNANTTIASS